MKLSRLLVVFALLATTFITSPAAAQVEDGPRPEPVASTIRWQSCFEAAGPIFECARVRVPLDHDQPRGPRISLAVVRIPATDQENKIGSLFLNPGGPGGSGVDFVLGAGPILYTDELRSKFDLVGFDPRGILRSTPLLCFDSFESALSITPPFAFPIGPEEEAVEKGYTEQLAGACATAGDIRDHMSTADVARDMDLMREMVGDEQLTYAGYSYGTYLGAVYANLFPDNVRAMVVDGVLDPVAWSTGTGDQAETLPFSTRLGSSIGAADTLSEFFRLCDEAGPAGCAFAPDSEARFDALADRLLEEPILLIDPFTGEEVPFRYSDLVGSTLGPMYNSQSWASHAGFLAFIESEASPQILGAQLGATVEAAGVSAALVQPRYPNAVEGFVGVACSDSVNPDNYKAWPLAAAADEEANGYFGRLWTHASAPCWNWPGDSPGTYSGPFTAETSNTVLVVSPTYDPATPISGALALDELLPNSELFVVDMWGHVTLFTSICADEAIAGYLVTGETPEAGLACSQDIAPFAPVGPPPPPGAAERAAVRAEVMTHMALIPR